MKKAASYILMVLALVAWVALVSLGQAYARQLAAGRVPDLFWAFLFGGLSGGGIVFIFILCSPKRHCPSCHYTLPRFRKPTSLKQSLFGGWTCPSCKAQIGPQDTVAPAESFGP